VFNQLTPISTTQMRGSQTARPAILKIILLVWISLPVVVWPPDSLATQAGNSARGATLSAQENISLEHGKPIERELSGGQSHFYKITMSSGQYLQVVVDQLGIDVVIVLFGPDGKKISEANSRHLIEGSEAVLAITEVPGVYMIEARSPDKTAKAGHYKINVEELRAATVEDKCRVAGAVIFREAEQLKYGTLEAKRKSIEKFHEALDLFRKAGDRSSEAPTLTNIGEVYWLLGETQKGLETTKGALPIFRALGDHHGEGETLRNIGVFYLLLGETQKSLDMLNEALPIIREVGDRSGEAITLSSIGENYRSLGEMQKALENYNEALPIRRAIGDRKGEAITLNNIGLVYSALGEFQKALDKHNEALPIRRAAGDRSGVATTLNNAGSVYQSLGEWQKALEKHNEALPIFQAVGNRRGEAFTLHNIGAVYQSLGETQKALEKYNEALPIFQAIGDRRGEAMTLNTIGQVYQSLGETQKALEKCNEALPISRAIGDHSGEAVTLLGFGAVYHLLGETQTALEKYNEALLLMREVGNRNGEAIALLRIARIEQKRGNLTQARQTIEQAVSMIESLRTNIAGQGARTSYFARRLEYFESYIDILMEQHRQNPVAGGDAVAFEVSERARARSLLELLRESRIDIRQGVDSSLLERERSLQQLLQAKAAAQFALLNSKHTHAQAEAAAKEIDSITTEYEELRAQIRARNPRYAALTQPQPLGLTEIQQQALDEDTLLLEYALGEKRSYLWLVSQRSIDSYELPTRAEVEAATRRVYELFTARPKRGTPPDPQLIAQARTLSGMLLGPVASRLGGKRLVVVAPGALSYLPFAALPEPEDEKRSAVEYVPLLAKHEVVTVPSASVLSTIRREMTGRQRATKSVAVLADPVFEASDPRLAAAKNGNSSGEPSAAPGADAELSGLTRAIRTMNFSDARAGFTRLAFSRQEAESIIALTPRGTGLKATDFGASRALALSPQLSQYRILHFATHGLLNSERPELSGLVFSLIDQEGKPQDGFLRLHEIYNLQLNADLIVLSACETGLGKEIKGEGLIGLTRGFMYSGAPRVVASLWNVDDLATAELMKLFYQRMLKDGLPAGAALRAAQLELSRQKRWASPYFWAGFVLHGEWL
jgi:CHAT domain-containing protein/predicted negative regulator of RcsB-dependent stress response